MVIMVASLVRPARYAALAAVSSVLASTAHAQIAAPVPVPDLTQPAAAPETLSVFQRPRPELDPLGVRLGSFVVKPSLDIGGTFNTNVFGTHGGERSDFIATEAPSVDVTSDWGNHAIAFHANGDFRQFATNTTENVNNFVTAVEGRLDILRGQYLEAAAGYQVQHEDRASPDATLGKFPTEYDVTTGRLSYVRSQTRIGVEVDATLDQYQFSNEPTGAGGGEFINSDRNREVYTLTPRVSYEINPGYQAFVEVTGNARKYDRRFDANGFERSSAGYGAAVGTQFDLGRIITGSAYVGYQDQQYDDHRLSSTSGLWFGGSLLWNVTDLTSAKLTLTRTIEETILNNSSGFFDTEVAATVEHELLRNILIGGGLTYANSDYQGISRSDDLYGVNATARWLFNRNVSAGVIGTWQQRSSNQSFNDFDREIVMLDVKVQF
jgi:hypothetical protein